MKKAIILCLVLAIIPFFGVAQTIENVDYISPFTNDFASVKKGEQWGFINKKGDLVVNFRNDLVPTKMTSGNYPILSNNRCLIKKIKDGISYFGYIDATGKTVIDPQFLNATNFNDFIAIVLKLVKENAGTNEVLDKKVVYYKYFEVVIDSNGKVEKYLNQEGTSIGLDKNKLSKPPKITSKQISKNLVATKDKKSKWKVTKIK